MREKIKSDDICGYRYEVQQLGAGAGKRLYLKVLKMVAPAVAAGLKGQDLSSFSFSNIKDVPWDDVAKAFVTSLDEDTFDTISAQLASTTEVWGQGFGDSGAPLDRNFDDHFAGRYKAMTGWLIFAVKVNLNDFFADKASVQETLAGLVKEQKASQSRST